MATTALTVAQAATVGALTGVNVDAMTFYDWNTKSLVSAAAAADVIETPVIDLNAVAPKCNRVNFQKIQTTAGADVMKILMSPDGTVWYTAPIYNGGVAGGTATANASVAELALTGLPAMRYIKGTITLAAAMSTQTAHRLALSLMRF